MGLIWYYLNRGGVIRGVIGGVIYDMAKNGRTITVKRNDLTAELDKRKTNEHGNSFSGLGNLAARRYFGLIKHNAVTLSRTFTNSEFALMIDAFNGNAFEPIGRAVACFADELATECDSRKLYAKWNVNESAILKKLRSLDGLAVLPLIDFIEYCWNHHRRLNLTDGRQILDKLHAAHALDEFLLD